MNATINEPTINWEPDEDFPEQQTAYVGHVHAVAGQNEDGTWWAELEGDTYSWTAGPDFCDLGTVTAPNLDELERLILLAADQFDGV